METNVKYTVVGAFVLTLLSLIILGIIWLSSGLSIEKYSTYLVFMQESVSGLSTDAPVEYNGVKVGAVKSISLHTADPRLVEVQLKIKEGTPITEGTEATLDSKGITGITFIALKDAGNNLNPLKAPPGQPYPVIKTVPSIFLRLDTALSKLNESFSTVSNSISSVLDPENLRSIKETLKHLNEVTAALSANTKELTRIIRNTSLATQQLQPTLQTFSVQTLPAIDSLLSNLNAVSQQIKENPAILIRGTSPQPLGPGEHK